MTSILKCPCTCRDCNCESRSRESRGRRGREEEEGTADSLVLKKTERGTLSTFLLAQVHVFLSHVLFYLTSVSVYSRLWNARTSECTFDKVTGIDRYARYGWHKATGSARLPSRDLTVTEWANDVSRCRNFFFS